MEEEEGEVEPLDIIGGKVDHMTCGDPPQCHLTQPQYLCVYCVRWFTLHYNQYRSTMYCT